MEPATAVPSFTVEYKDYYKVMGVGRDASADEIKRAYRRLARKYHPDVSKEKDSEERFKEVGEAYEVLRDPDKRAAYDALGSGRPGEEFRPPPEWHFDFRGEPGAHDRSEFFESLFGGLGGRGAFSGGSGEPWARIDLTLEEAYQGTERSVKFERVAVDERGRMRSVPQTIKVKIPAGVVDGQQVRVAERGAAHGAVTSNVLIVRLLPHRWFRVEGRDVWLDLPVAPWEAALGETVRVPTLGGRVALKLPRGARADQQLRLKGRGLPGSPPGDQFVVLKVTAPVPKTQADEALYRQLANALRTNPRAALEE